MTNNKNQFKDENEQAVGQAVSNVEVFLKKNGKTILNIILGIVVIIAAIFAINKWYIKPIKQEALSQMFVAEHFFSANDYEKALNGDGNAPGFSDIIDQYGRKAGESVYLYAGICQLQLKNYNEAINYLKKYNGKDNILAARALCCIGDSYVGLGKNEEGLSYYEKAAGKSDNVYAAQYLFKAAITAEELGQKEKALKYYKEISVKYPQSVEGYDINKYIYRLENN